MANEIANYDNENDLSRNILKQPDLCRGYSAVQRFRDQGYKVVGVRDPYSEGGFSGFNILSLRDRPSTMEKVLGKVGIRFQQRAYCLGTVWTNNTDKGASTDKTWVLESNSNDHVARVSTILSELVSGNNVSVEVKMSNNSPGLVRLPKGYSLN